MARWFEGLSYFCMWLYGLVDGWDVHNGYRVFEGG